MKRIYLHALTAVLFAAAYEGNGRPVFAAADKGGAGGTPTPIPTPTPTPATGAVITPPEPITGSGSPAPVATEAVATAVKTSAIRMDVPPPVKKSGGRGGQTLYDFDKLEIGGSFGVFDKTAKAVASTVASANKRMIEEVKDATGAVIMVPNPKKPGETMKLTKATKKFVSAAVDPKTDPDKASVRVWRIAV